MHLGERYLGLNVDHEAYAFNVRRVSEPNVERDAAWSYEGQLLAEAVEELQRPKEIEIMIQFSAPH